MDHGPWKWNVGPWNTDVPLLSFHDVFEEDEGVVPGRGFNVRLRLAISWKPNVTACTTHQSLAPNPTPIQKGPSGVARFAWSVCLCFG